MGVLQRLGEARRAFHYDCLVTTRPLCRFVLALYRAERALGRVMTPLRFLVHNVLLHIELPRCVPVGPGLRVPHPYGIIISPHASIGIGVTLFHGVTLGESEFKEAAKKGAPSLGDGVYVGTGALLIGKIHVGDGSVIGAGAVVTRDVPARHVVVGHNQIKPMTGADVRLFLATYGFDIDDARLNG